MNDFDEFAEIALGIFVGLTVLIWLLTYLERTLVQPVAEKRARRLLRRKSGSRSPAEPDDDYPT
jgi:hypothetical protein